MEQRYCHRQVPPQTVLLHPKDPNGERSQCQLLPAAIVPCLPPARSSPARCPLQLHWASMMTVCNRTIPLNSWFSEARNRGRQDLLRLALFLLLALGASSGAIAQAISRSAARRRNRFRCGSARRQARREGAILRSRRWSVRPELFSRGPQRLSPDPHHRDRARGRLWRRRRRHVPPAAPGSGRRRLGAARHIRRGRVRDAERHVGCLRRRFQQVARRAPAHARRCRHRTAQSRLLRTRERAVFTQPGRALHRCSSRGSSRRRTGNSRPSRRGPSACATSMPTWTPSHARTPPCRAPTRSG